MKAQSSGKPAGFIRVEISGTSQRLSSIPFTPFNSSLDNIFSGQLTGEISAETADRIVKWDALAQAYVTAYKCDKTGDPAKDGKWFLSGTYTTSGITLAPGGAFWIQNQHAAAQAVFICGQVVMDNSKSVTLQPQMNLFSYPFTSKIKLNSTNLKSDGAYGAEIQGDGPDVLSKISPDADFWLYSKPGFLNDGRWFDTDNVLATEEIKASIGYWYNRQLTSSFTWTENRPYANPFTSVPGTTPEITGIAPNGALDAVTLTISCSGAAGETLEIFFKDIGETDSLCTDSGWLVAAVGLSTNSATSITWTDNGEASPVSPVISRSAVTVPFMRVYLVSRQDMDTDGDGISDGREKFMYGTNPLCSDTDGEGLSDAAEINTHSTDPNNADSDNDGFTDADEINIYSTDPNSISSVPNDTTPPSTPADLTLKSKTSSIAAFSWTVSTDNYGVKEYVILRDGREIAKVNSAFYVDCNLADACTYSYTVKARDYAGNASGESSELQVQTGNSGATTLYVNASTGNDENAGTVSNPKRTIQAAVSAASSGNLIIVNAGNYNEALTLDGKDLLITGVDGASKTIIDASGLDSRVMNISNSPSSLSTVIEGLTFSGGISTANGGGIMIDTASPVIANCIIKSNSSVNGGGIAVSGTGSAPVLVNSAVSSNTASGNGGGIYFTQGTLPVIKQSLISSNAATGLGGGIYGEE